MSNWKATSDLYEALIDKPRMSGKLLSKPPFKYLFDIISETAKKTGFGNGNFFLTQASTKAKNLSQTTTGRRKEKSTISPKLSHWSRQ